MNDTESPATGAMPTGQPMTTALTGPAPEVAVTKDMVRRGLIVAPVLIALCGFVWGMEGVWGCAYGIAIILINFGLAAGIVAGTARISLGMMMGAVLFGYLIRLGLILLAISSTSQLEMPDNLRLAWCVVTPRKPATTPVCL